MRYNNVIFSSLEDGDEIILDSKKEIVSKTDKNGIITYANEYFAKISGYNEWELIGKPHSVIRHADMPKAVFKYMWSRIQNGEDVRMLVKNRTKDGHYYWVQTHFEMKQDPISNEIFGYSATRRAASKKEIEEITPIYNIMVEIEKNAGVEASLNYFLSAFNKERMAPSGTSTTLFSSLKRLIS